MATNPTQETPATQATPLWPAPFFVLGVGALVAVCLCRPLFHGPAGSDRALNAAIKELSRADGDPKHAIDLAQRAVALGTKRRGEAGLVLGSAHLRLAEKAEPAAAQPLWQNAREYLEQAETEGVPSEADRVALGYHLAKVDFHDNRNPTKVIERLEACAEQIEAKAEAYDLLTRAYLRLAPPNLEKALDANRLLREVPNLNGPDLAAAQLTGAELLLRTGKPEDARKDLDLLLRQGGQFAQPAVRVRARLLLARCRQDEKRYDLAVDLYNRALKDDRPSISQPAQVNYNLGLCYRELKKPEEAIAAWKECMSLARGKEAQAVGIVLAEVCLLNNSPPETVIESLTKAIEGINSPRDWDNQLVGLSLAREVFERAIESFRTAHRHDLALKTLEPYSRLAESRRALEWRGLLCAEWARARREPPPGSGPNAPPIDPTVERETLELFRQAAVAYGQAAELPGLKPADVANYLWAAVPCHLTVGEPKEREAARLKLKKLVEPALGLEPARLGEAWYLLGEECRAADQPNDAETAYQECLKYVTRFAYLARYQLAKASLLRGEIDAARDALKQNLSQLTWDSDAEAMSQTLFELCGLLYRRGAYREAARYYEEALGRHAGKFKDKGELTRARYQLADSYRQIAAQENMASILNNNYSPETRAQLEKMHRERLTQAAEEFAGLDTFLETPEGQNCLTAEQRSQVPFITAKCWYNLGLYQKALAVYERLIDKNKGKVEGLDALGGAVSCHAAMGKVDMVRQRLLEIDKALSDMPEEIRKPWKEWLEKAKQGLRDV